MLGDDGQAIYTSTGLIASIASTDAGFGGNDIINVSGGGNAIIGGAGADTITVGGPNNTILGDDGQASYSATGFDLLTSIGTIFPTDGGNDVIDVASGDNAIIGGYGADTITVGGPDNTILGDNGVATFSATTGDVTEVTSFTGLAGDVPSVGGNDTINVSSGNNVIIGGFGADAITIGGSGNTVLGDNGEAFFNSNGDGLLSNNNALGIAIETTDQTLGGNDTITINGTGSGNVIFGGSGADAIAVNGNGNNVIFGDNGTASYIDGVLTEVATTGETAPAELFGNFVFSSSESNNSGVVYGGNDTITVGNGNNVIVGGLGADTITTGTGSNVVLGDSGFAVFNPSTGTTTSFGNLIEVASDPVTFASGAPQLDLTLGSTSLGVSSADTITLGNGNNVVIGGADADTIVVGATGQNVIIGDDGEADYTNGILTDIFSTDGTLGIGGNDTISGPGGTPGGSGNNVVIGGIGADTVTLGGANNTVIGDDGKATFGTSGQLLTITTQDPTFGGNDLITVTGGNNVIFGGTGADTIKVQGASSGNVIVGDDGDATFASEPVSSAVATSVLTYIETTNQTDGGDDIITTGDGNNVILGGSGADTITVGNGSSVILGDNGNATFAVALASGSVAASDATYSRTLTNIETTAQKASGTQTSDPSAGGFVHGGDDTITTGNGNNVIIGGLGADTITAGNGNNIVLGDSGTANFNATTGVLTSIFSTFVGFPVGGTTDTGTSSNDTIVLGTANGTGTGNNTVFGGSGNDTITVYGNGNNVILGDDGEALYTNGIITTVFSIDAPDGDGGNDTIHAPGNGNDVVIGGVGADTIVTGSGNNYLLGDDGVVDFVTISAAAVVSRAETADAFYGGNDNITAGNGVNSVIGGDGNDTVTLGNGNDDIVLGDNGEIVQAFGSAGAVQLNSDGNSHRDVVLEEIGEITGAIAIDSASDAASATAASIADANLILLAGEFNANGSQTISQTSGAWDAQALLLSLIPDGNDTITVGSGNDVVIGQGGNNTITANGGNDMIFGNGASNTAPVSSNIPSIINAVDIISSAVTSIVLPTSVTGTTSELVVPTVNLLPAALTTNTPQLQMPPPGFGTLGSIADSGNLSLTGGQNLQVFASVVPSVLDGSPALPGSNTINGGSGNDTIFGNLGQIGSLVTTGITQIDNQLEGLSVTMLDMLDELSSLSTVADAVGGGAGTIAFENNTITVTGAGSDTIFANVGEYLIPDVAFAQGSGTLASNAIALDTYLLDMQEIFGDMSFVAHEAGSRIVSSYTGPAAHLLEIGNDTINLTANSGNDLVVGDTGIILTPGVAPSSDNWATNVPSATLTSVQQQLQTLESNFDSALVTQFATDHPFTTMDGAAASAGTGFNLDIGNDTIMGGSGNSTIIGDDAFILDPVIGSGMDGADGASTYQAMMVSDVDRLFIGAYSVSAADAESWGYLPELANKGGTDWSSNDGFVLNDATKADITIGSDNISAGSGSDHIYGDTAYLLPSLGSSPGLITSFYAYAIDEPGQTGTSNFAYTYGFGVFGSVQQWASDPTSPSKYAVDADTITGGAGNNVIFGELGDDVITGGAGNDEISGGYGVNTVSGGGGTNYLEFNRSTDTHVQGSGTDIAQSSLNAGAGSALLAMAFQSVVGLDLSMNGLETLIQTDGSTSLVQVGNNYYLFTAGTTTGVELISGLRRLWSARLGLGPGSPLGAVATPTGYDVAWHNSVTGNYQVWALNSSGVLHGNCAAVGRGLRVESRA